MPSISLWAAYNIVAPGVSYTPLDLIPTNLFSTMSRSPIPFSPPILLRYTKRSYGSSITVPSSLLRTFTGIPSLNVTTILVSFSGASWGITIFTSILFCIPYIGSSRIPASWLICMRFSSSLYGFERLALTGIFFSAAYFKRSVLPLNVARNSGSFHGAITLMSGLSE